MNNIVVRSRINLIWERRTNAWWRDLPLLLRSARTVLEMAPTKATATNTLDYTEVRTNLYEYTSLMFKNIKYDHEIIVLT